MPTSSRHSSPALYPTVQWMREQGLHWVLMYGRQSFEVGGKQHFYGGLITEAVGGGKGLVDSLFDAAQARGIDIAYGAKVTGLLTDDYRTRDRGIGTHS